MTITASQVKELRESTGVGMMDCKKALVETGGDMDRAIVYLREKGLSRAAKKAGRSTAEGTVEVLVSDDGLSGAMVELNCETDFVAKNEEFKKFAHDLARLVVENKFQSVDELARAKLGTETVDHQLSLMIGKIGENMRISRVMFVTQTAGHVTAYSHMGGRIGALVSFKGDVKDKAALSELGTDLAMHVAACSPKYLKREQVSSEEIEQEKQIARKKLEEEGKTGDIVEKIITGQLNKFYKEICLLEQPFVKEPKQGSIQDIVKKRGAGVELTDYARFELGQGA